MGNNTLKTLEPRIKVDVIKYLYEKNKITKDDTIINEFTIGNHTRRVDLAFVTDRKMHAYEIKSDGDSLYRLAGQTKKYLEYFDKVTIVATPKHIAKILELELINVEVLEYKDGEIRLKKRGKTVKISHQEKLFELMNLRGLRALAKDLGIPYQLEKRTQLEGYLREVSPAKVRSIALQYLRKKYEITTALFWKSSGNVPDELDLANLSLYKALKMKTTNSYNIHYSNTQKAIYSSHTGKINRSKSMKELILET